MIKSTTITAIVNSLQELGVEDVGNKDVVEVGNVSSLDAATKASVVWIKFSGEKALEALRNCEASLVICGNDFEPNDDLLAQKRFLKTPNPKLAIATIIREHFEEKLVAQIHPTAFVHEDAIIGENVYVGPFTYIGKCSIGSNCIIWGNCYIQDGVEMHNNVEIHAGCVIGDIGSGYAKKDNGEYVKFPHIGGLILEENVEVGALTYINRGALSDTIVRRGAKIGNAVCIGHNVEIGENTIVIANSVVAGSTKLGKNVYVAHSSTLRNGLEIGDNVTIGMGAVVTKNIENNNTYLGNPAEEIGKFKEWIAIRKKLLQKPN